MGIRLSHQKSPPSDTPLIISVIPLSPDPLNSDGGLTEQDGQKESGKTATQKPSLVHTSSKASLLSDTSNSSIFIKDNKKRRVSFDLLAEMAYAFPEEPLSPMLVEIAPGSEEDGQEEICDGGEAEEKSRGEGKEGEGEGGSDDSGSASSMIVKEDADDADVPLKRPKPIVKVAFARVHVCMSLYYTAEHFTLPYLVCHLHWSSNPDPIHFRSQTEFQSTQ